MLQNVAPAQLSALYFENADYILQELLQAKDRIDFKMIEHDFKVVACVIEDMAVIAASAHLRGIGRLGSCPADELIEFGNQKKWQTDLLDYAVNYKKKVFSDYDEFCSHVRKRAFRN